MVSKKTLNARNLESLGAARLAELLLEISAGDAAAKRRLRLELAGTVGPAEAAREIRRRLTSITQARRFVDWRGVRALSGDLEAQRRAIAETVAPQDPAEALELAWRFLSLAGPVMERCDDSSGTVMEVFHYAMDDLGDLAAAARPEPEALADRVFDAIRDNGYGQYDGLIATTAPVLGERGLERLKALVEGLSAQPASKRDDDDRVIGWGAGGPIMAREAAESESAWTARLALQDIADAQGDVDGYVAQFDAEARRSPPVAARIAERLLAAGRAEEALQALEAAETGEAEWRFREWRDVRLAVLEALGRPEEAQALRWAGFERTLSATDLRAYLKRLPDFEDMEAEERALDRVAAHPSVHAALAFLVNWPALDRAAALVLARAEELDGDRYETLTPAAEALAERHPLAATIALRAMIDFSLGRARSSRYGHAARHLAECARLAGEIDDWGEVEPHEDWLTRLHEAHRRKQGFWGRVGDAAG